MKCGDGCSRASDLVERYADTNSLARFNVLKKYEEYKIFRRH